MDYQEEQKEIDKIIEKIGREGYAGLTAGEKYLFFNTKLHRPGSTRFDTKFEFGLTIILLAVLIFHGIQRLWLAQEMSNTIKLGSVMSSNNANTVLNIVLGIALVTGSGYTLISFLGDHRKKKIVFFYRKDDRNMRRKYYFQLMVIGVLLLLVVLKTATYWMLFFEKMGI